MLIERFEKYLINGDVAKNTVVSYRNGINKLYDYCSRLYGEKDEIKLWSKITVFDVEDCIYNLQSVDTIEYGNIKNQENTTRHYSPATINLYISGIKKFLTYIYKAGVTENDRGTTLKPKRLDQNTHKDIIRLEEIKKLINVTYIRCKGDNLFEFNSTRNRFFIGLLSISGLRQEEAAQLTSDMIKSEEVDGEISTVIYIPKRIVKNKMDKIIVLSKSVERYYKEWMNEREQHMKEKGYENDIIFISGNNKKLTNKTINQMLDKYRVRAEIEIKVTAHDFRHRCASALNHNGISLGVIKAVLGWTNNDISDRYIHIGLDQIKQACGSIDV